MPNFVIHGHSYNVDADTIEEALKGCESWPVTKYFVEVDGHRYPIKQVIATVCGIPPISFTSMDAYRILEKLGYKVQSTYQTLRRES